ncbi:unnamed protein product [Boreogadus saida]
MTEKCMCERQTYWGGWAEGQHSRRSSRILSRIPQISAARALSATAPGSLCSRSTRAPLACGDAETGRARAAASARGTRSPIGREELTQVHQEEVQSYYDIAEPLTQQSYYDIAEPLTQQSYYDIAEPLIQQSYYDIAEPLIQQSYYDIAEPLIQQ